MSRFRTRKKKKGFGAPFCLKISKVSYRREQPSGSCLRVSISLTQQMHINKTSQAISLRIDALSRVILPSGTGLELQQGSGVLVSREQLSTKSIPTPFAVWQPAEAPKPAQVNLKCMKTRALGLRGWSVPPRYFGTCALVMGLHKAGLELPTDPSTSSPSPRDFQMAPAPVPPALGAATAQSCPPASACPCWAPGTARARPDARCLPFGIASFREVCCYPLSQQHGNLFFFFKQALGSSRPQLVAPSKVTTPRG